MRFCVLPCITWPNLSSEFFFFSFSLSLFLSLSLFFFDNLKIFNREKLHRQLTVLEAVGTLSAVDQTLFLHCDLWGKSFLGYSGFFCCNTVSVHCWNCWQWQGAGTLSRSYYTSMTLIYYPENVQVKYGITNSQNKSFPNSLLNSPY